MILGHIHLAWLMCALQNFCRMQKLLEEAKSIGMRTARNANLKSVAYTHWLSFRLPMDKSKYNEMLRLLTRWPKSLLFTYQLLKKAHKRGWEH